MKHFFVFSALYFLVSVAILFLGREDTMSSLIFVFFNAVGDSQFLWNKWPYVALVVAVGWWLTRHTGFKHRIVPALYAFFGCLLFSAAFSLVKTTIPHVVPFYADPMLANLDAALHLGQDPWALVHKLSDYVPANWLVLLYFDLWLWPALFLPLLIALTDTDAQRTKRYLILYAFCWIGLGNVVATMFSSVGPVYYDRLLGAERFVGLTMALESSGVSTSIFGGVQEYLWIQYVENGQSFGSGISAFPSVHVGVATVVAFYLAERSRYLMPLGLAFLIAISFASVYNGWHYAVDGYVSILLITAAWAVMTRRKVTFPRVVAA
jgi:hypothetical protein